LDALLSYLQARTIILVGLTTDACILTTACEIHIRDLNLYVPAGCVAASEQRLHAFRLWFRAFNASRDGDPLDVMVLMDAPAHVGCLIEIRILGAIEAEQIEDGKAERNDRLLGVAIHSYDHQNLDSIDDVSKTLLDQVEAFFISYNKQRGKKFKVMSLGGPKKALKLLKQGMSAFNDNGTRNS